MGLVFLNKMKILYSNKSLYPFEGGGDISALNLLEYLSKEHDVVAVYNGTSLENIKIKSYPQNAKQFPGLWINSYFLNKKFERILTDIVEKEKPDLIICQDYLIPASVKIAKKFGIKVIAFLRSYIHISIDGFMTYKPEDNKPGKTSLFVYKIQYPFYLKVIKQFQKALKNADLVIAPSHYLSDITFKYCGVKCEVLRPFVFLDKSDTNGNYITYINPDLHKGVKIFEEIVGKLPDKKFLVVGKNNYKLNKQNVKILGWIKNMKEIYSETRLIIVPSIWPEGCPRVGIEAMANGIPFIVSGIGGLKEEAGGCGFIIDDYLNSDSWVRAINKFDDKEFYEKMSKNAKLKYKEFEINTQFKKFDVFLEDLFKN